MKIWVYLSFIIILLVLTGFALSSYHCLKRKKRLLGIILGSLFLSILVSVLIIDVYMKKFWAPLAYCEHIISPAEKCTYTLYKDKRTLKKPSWHVFKLPNNINPKDYHIRANYLEVISMDNYEEGWEEKRILYVLSHTNQPKEDGHIYLVNSKHLVLTIDGLFQGLYDITRSDTLIDDFHSIVFESNKNNSFVGMFHKIAPDPESVLESEEVVTSFGEYLSKHFEPDPKEDDIKKIISCIMISGNNQNIIKILESEIQNQNTEIDNH